LLWHPFSVTSLFCDRHPFVLTFLLCDILKIRNREVRPSNFLWWICLKCHCLYQICHNMHAYIFRFPPVQNMPPVACLSQWVGSRTSIVLAEVGGLVGCNAVLSLCVLSTWCYGLNLFKLAALNISRVYPWSWLTIAKAKPTSFC
jgi:hypothetical protein